MPDTFVETLVGDIGKFPAGTVIIVNTETGDYLTARSEDAAFDAFESRYGWGVPAHLHVVGASPAGPKPSGRQ